MAVEAVLLSIWVAFPAMTIYLLGKNYFSMRDRARLLDTIGAKRFVRILRARSLTVGITVASIMVLAFLSLLGVTGRLMEFFSLLVLAAIPIVFFAEAVYETWEGKSLAAT